MPYSTTFTGCRLVIRDRNGRFLTETKIIQYDRSTLTMTVSCDKVDLMQYNRLQCNIFHGDSLFRFNGNPKRINKSDGNYVVSLFNGKKVEARAAKRYDIDMSANIIGKISDNNDVERLDSPFEVELMNISTSGVLIKAVKHTFSINDCFQLLLRIGKEDTVINNMVVRMKDLENQEYTEYGCEFLSLYNDDD